MENNIRSLLGLASAANTVVANTPSTLPDFNQIETSETYFGLERQEYMSPEQQAVQGISNYTLPTNLDLNQFGVAAIGF